MDSIFYWLLDRIINFLARINPARAKKADAIKAEADRLAELSAENERQRKISEAQYFESSENRKHWDKLAAESQEREKESEQRLRASQDRIRAISDEAKKLKEVINRRSDVDVLRDRL
jgi:septal ring factor EnvC (AmiA/AmiB activator)